MNRVKNYLSLVTFSHTIFAMPFALIGFFLGITSFGYWQSFYGQHTYEWFAFSNIESKIKFSNYFEFYPKSLEEFLIRFILVILCMIFARSAAMAFNRWLDAKYDAINPRTAVREIPAGVIKPNNALIWGSGRMPIKRPPPDT